MTQFVAAAMVGTVAAIVVELARGDRPVWVGWVSLPFVVAPVLVSGGRTVPSAVRLGARRDPLPRQSELAKAVLLDHLFCAGAIATALAVQLIFGS
jgi:hypothetical protein